MGSYYLASTYVQTVSERGQKALAATVLFFMAAMAISCSIAVATVVAVAEAEQEKQAAGGKDEEQG